ncbi:MAG: hypothetical protein ACXVZP_07090 [Gaiellaceae bacterium]
MREELARARTFVAELWSEPLARLLLIVVVLVSAITLIVLALAWRPGTRSPDLLRDPLTVRQTLTPTTALFGDRIEAEVDVYSDAAQIDPGSVQLEPDFGPYAIAATSVERARQGAVSLLRTRFSLDCLTPVCIPPPKQGRLFHFAQLRVVYRQKGTPLQLVEPWPALQVYSRLPRSTSPTPKLADEPPAFGTGTAASPTLLRVVLALLAAALALAGAALVVAGFWPRFFYSLRRWRRLSPLDQALTQLDAATRIEDEAVRRRVLDQLANRLREADLPSLERESRALAWGSAAPEADGIELLRERIRGGLNGGAGP